MASRVSVTTASSAGTAATRASDGAAASRDSAIAATPTNGFSSALSAAARSPTAPPNSSDTQAADSNGSRGANNTAGAAKSDSPASGSTATAASSGNNDQATSAAATVAEADASSVEADSATIDGKTLAKTSGKSRATTTDNSSGTSATDAATLALLLATSGLQVDGRATSGQQNSDGKDATSDDSRAAQVTIAGAVAANLALAALGVGVASSPSAPTNAGNPAGNATGSLGEPGKGTLTTHVSTDRSTAAVLDSLAANSAPGDQAATDSSLLQDKSGPDGAPFTQQSLSAIGANGLPEMIRSLAPAPTATIERTIATPVSDRNWSEGVAAQVQWQVSNNVQSATLQLSPEHLGPLEVRIDVQPTQVNVSFTASHPDTRSALEQSVPRLREILANGGLTLGQATVQQEARPGSQYAPSPSRSASLGPQSVDSVSLSPTRTLGLLDEYA